MVKNFANTIRGVDKRYLVSGFSSLGSNHFAGILIALLTSYFFANYLSKGVYGNYQFVLTILGVMSIFTLRGVGKQIVREYVQTGRSILIPKTVQFILYALPVSAVGLTSSGYFYLMGNPKLAIALLITSIAFPFLNGLPLYSTHILAKEDFRRQAILGVIQNAIPAVSLISTILLGGGLIVLTLIYCVSQILTLSGLYFYTINIYSIPLREKSPHTSNELHLSISQSILEVGKIADKLIIFSFFGAASFASFMIAKLPAQELQKIPMIIRTLILPKFSRYSFEQVRSKIFGKTALLFSLFTFIAILYALLSPFMYKIIFPLYPESIKYTQLLIIAFPLASSLVMNQALTVFDKTKELYTVNVIFTFVKIVLLVTFAFYYHILGVIYAVIIASAIRFILLSYFCFKT